MESAELVSKYIMEVLTFVGVCFAAWFVATDKNRNDLFKRKLTAYQELNKIAATTFSLAIKLNTNKEMFEEKYRMSKIELYEYVLGTTLILSNDVSASVTKFMRLKPENNEELRVAYNEFTNFMSKDLGLGRLEAITRLSNVEIESLLGQYKNKGKGQ